MTNIPVIRDSGALAFKLIVVCYASVHVFSLTLQSGTGDETCLLPVPDVIVTRTAHKHGFHRNVVTDVRAATESGRGSCQQCSLHLVEFLPEGMYVDTHQIKALGDFGSPQQVVAFEEIDAEKPEYLSPNHTIYVYSHNVTLASGQLTAYIDLPVHLRYHLPSDDSDVHYSSVYLPPPDVFVHCRGCSRELCSSNSTSPVVQAPCTAENKSLCIWTQLIYNKGSETELEFEVPVGQAGQSVLVTAVTLATIMSGTAILLWTIVNGGSSSNKKQR